MKINWLTKNIGLKVMAFFLAVVTWLYIVAELGKSKADEKATLMKMYPYKVSGKKIPIRLNEIGVPREGYEVERDKIVLSPDTCILIGPEDVINEINEVTTEPVDISEHVKTFTKELSLLPIGKNVILEGQFAKVTIPIRQLPPTAQSESKGVNP